MHHMQGVGMGRGKSHFGSTFSQAGLSVKNNHMQKMDQVALQSLVYNGTLPSLCEFKSS